MELLTLRNFPIQRDSPGSGTSSIPPQEEYHLDFEEGTLQLLSQGQKKNLCLNPDLQKELLDFVESREVCIYETLPKSDLVCTQEYIYGLGSLRLRTPVEGRTQLNLYGSNGCGVEISFCNREDLEQFKGLRQEILNTPKDSCEDEAI